MTVFQVPSASVIPIAQKVTNTSANVIIDCSTGRTEQAFVPVLYVGTFGGTPNLTVDLYDVANTTAYYLVSDGGSTWNALAVTSKQGVIFHDITVPKGWQLRVTLSGNSADVTGFEVTNAG